ncbi:MAG: prolyl oligopeptidase family serine peptidase [Bacteroidota bacterium]
MAISPASFAQKDSKLFDKLLHIDKLDTLPYRLLKPANPNLESPVPLVIFLHGAGERGRENEVQIKHISNLFLEPKNRSRFPCYVVAPQCPKNKSWTEYDKSENQMSADPSRPMEMLIQLLDQILKEYPIDQNRIYVTGLSMGGYGTWDLLARFPHRFAAAVPICGGGDVNIAPKIKHIPVWAFHGARDNVVPPMQSRMMIKALQDAGGLPGYTEYPDIEHNSWGHAYREPHLMPWLFEQKLPDKKQN